MHAIVRRQFDYAPFFMVAAMSATIGAFYGRMALRPALGERQSEWSWVWYGPGSSERLLGA